MAEKNEKAAQPKAKRSGPRKVSVPLSAATEASAKAAADRFKKIGMNAGRINKLIIAELAELGSGIDAVKLVQKEVGLLAEVPTA